MATKIIHFSVNGRLEQAEFRADCSAADVERSVPGGGGGRPAPHPEDVQQRRRRGERLPPAGGQQRGLVLPAGGGGVRCAECGDAQRDGRPGVQATSSGEQSQSRRGPDSRRPLRCEEPSGVFQEEAAERGTPELDGSLQGGQRPSPLPKPSQLSLQEERQQVRRTFLNMNSLQVTEEVREHLKTPIFDNWQWEEAEMLLLLQVMFTDLNLLTEFHMELDILQNFLFQVYCHYNNIPFHNFRHCFCVTQMENVV
ncbi:uncharacterized protein LOC115005127 [Cottoperca gobio]|uniref:Uncharacterized protein LOC115005127 n=1 Tax=Cottoperca gobio TaxID=56716 RepID=A0A6J2PBY4_COTGO|nr:uncharacterized protein LOC115005127 [Cottoperca gobio]